MPIFVSSVPEHLAVWSSSIYYSQCPFKARKTIKSFFRALVPPEPTCAVAKSYSHMELSPDTNRSPGGTRALFSSSLYLIETYKKRVDDSVPKPVLLLSASGFPSPRGLDNRLPRCQRSGRAKRNESKRSRRCYPKCSPWIQKYGCKKSQASCHG